MQENAILCVSGITQKTAFLFHDVLMENSKVQKIIGVIIDNKLNFKSHISELCKKTSQKVAALSRCLVIYITPRKN